MNKGMKRFVSVLLAVVLTLALSVSALADGEYTYTVRIFSGEIGSFSGGQTVLTYTGQTAGSVVTFDPASVSLPADSPYYVRGIRESGRDNNTVSSNTINVQGDVDYVVAYGIKGELVAYTVNYVDEAGNTLAPSEMYYGNAGDKPVVAYLYIDGYEPQAYNLTATLSENAADNVFTFVYSQIVVATPVPAEPSPTPYVYTEGAETPAEGGAAAGGLPAGAGAVELPGAGGEEAVAGENVPEANAPEAEEQPAAAEQAPAQEPEAEPAQEPVQIEEDETPQANGPQEIIDLDDTPLGDKPAVQERPQTELQKEREQVEKKFYISAGLLGVSLIAIVALVVALVRKRKA